MTITAAMVKELRERTGAGMMECKKALAETNGDMETAIQEMRKRGQAKAAKRAGRIAAEGIITLAATKDNKQAFIIEVNSETDFVARDANFQAFAATLVQNGLEAGIDTLEKLLALPGARGEASFEDARQELINKIGENIKVRRVARLVSEGIVGTYKHGERIGVLVAIDKENPELAKDVAMHIAATSPQAIDENALSADVLAKEKEVFVAQAKESGKPDDIIEKMVQGRLAKFKKEVCLVSQPFVKDPDQTIADLLKKNDAKVISFVRFEVGEGIEKETVDFAEEVKAQVKGSE